VARTVEDIDNRLEYLKEIQLIKERKRMEELEYLFKHALAQEAAYESLLVQRRKELHKSVADSIEKVFNERLHEFYGILSYHYINAEDWDKAEEYMLKAGEEALKSSASSEALHYYQRAIELYIKKHGDDVDNKKLAEMEENIGYAFLNKGFFVDAVDYFDRTAIHRGEKIYSSLFFIIPKLALSFISILLHLYLPSITKKKIPTDEDDRMMRRTFKIATALIVVDIKRCLLENMEAVTQAFKYDISKSQGCFNILAGGGALFINSGISVSMARKFMDYLWKNVSGEPPDVLLYVYRITELFYNCYSGHWQGKIDESSVNEALRAGDFMIATSQLLYLGYEKIELGNFTGCETIIEKLHQIYEEYNFEHAGSDVFLLKSKSSMKKRELYDAQTYADQSVMQANKTRWPGRAVECLGIKARIEILSENLGGARETIEEAEKLVRQVGKESMLIDWYCAHVMGMFLYDLTMLEKAILMDNRNDVERFRKATLRIGKVALSYTKKKLATERTESFRLMGTYYWLINKQKKALTWWSRSIQEGERLGAKIELSRTYFEVGKRLLEANSKFKELDGMTAEDYLEKARVMFEEMDLQWDLDELEKVRAYRYH
jgi:tetratricopeptide (TPR) repeat protein